MDIQTLARFFMWCTIINGGILVLGFLFKVFGGDLIYRLHGRYYPMPKESFNHALYVIMGVYKVLVIVLFLAPWIALTVIGV
jgi:hypothetical protein